MSKTFSRSLARKKVMSNDGMLIGTVRNIMVDLDTGQVVDLIVNLTIRSGQTSTGWMATRCSCRLRQ